MQELNLQKWYIKEGQIDTNTMFVRAYNYTKIFATKAQSIKTINSNTLYYRFYVARQLNSASNLQVASLMITKSNSFSYASN